MTFETRFFDDIHLISFKILVINIIYAKNRVLIYKKLTQISYS